MNTNKDCIWSQYLDRYSQGEWRAVIFHDLILAEINQFKLKDSLALLDIGCGKGFDDDVKLQSSLSRVSCQYIGVEPDEHIELPSFFSTTYRCRFEDAPIPEGSIDIAFAVMVLEHLKYPQEFWNKINYVLRGGGVFWGFTVDKRHWFASMSRLMGYFKIKDLYLNLLHGKIKEGRYENYPAFYKCNTPSDIENLTKLFYNTTIINFHRVGTVDYYLPTRLRELGRVIDRVDIRLKRPGNILAVRVVK